VIGWWLSVAMAAEIGVVGVHDGSLDAAAQRSLAAALVGAVETGGRHDGLGPDELARRVQGREELVLQEGLLADGKRLMEDGRLLYQQAMSEDAAFSLEAAVRSLEDGVRWTRSVRELWEAWMLLATARLGTGDEAGARDAVGAAVALHPARRPDPAVFPPDIISLHEAERKVATGEGGSLLIETLLPGAEVWVDGRPAGRSPWLAEGVAPGRHFVHVRGADGAIGFTAVEIDGSDAKVKVDLAAPTLGAAARTMSGRSAQTQSLYDAVGRYAGVDVLVLAGRVDGVYQVQLFAPETDSFGKPVVLSATDGPDALGTVVAALVAEVGANGELPMTSTTYTSIGLDVAGNRLLAQLLLAPVKPVDPTPAPVDPGPSDGPVAERPKWPMWLGIGLGVAAVAAGGTALGLVLGKPDETAGSLGTIVFGPPNP
jgi:hypothetical protein